MNYKPKVSVVIPSYNEADYISRLLTALNRQNFDSFEVIISDAKSTDGTKRAIEPFNDRLDIKFISAPAKGPGYGRNVGAKAASGEWLLFLDADVDIKDPWFIKKLLDGTKAKSWNTSSGQMKVQKGSLLGKIGHSQGYLNLMAHTKHPIFQGYCMFTNRKVFEQNNGFNEKIRYGEDNDYATRVAKYGFGFVKNATYWVDPRRYQQEGVGLLVKNVRHEIYRLTHGFSFEGNKSSYEFGKHKAHKK